MKFVLIMVLVMSGTPQRIQVEQPSLEECWKHAQEFVMTKDTPEFKDLHGVEQIGAACATVFVGQPT